MSDIDSDQLIQSCKQLETELELIKSLKLQAEVQKYQADCQIEYQQQIQNNIKDIDRVYASKKLELQKQYQSNMNKLVKNNDENGKQLKAFQTILEQLRDRKAAIQIQLQENIDKLMAFKEKCIADWKKSSNQAIKKCNSQNIQNMVVNNMDKLKRISAKSPIKHQQQQEDIQIKKQEEITKIEGKNENSDNFIYLN